MTLKQFFPLVILVFIISLSCNNEEPVVEEIDDREEMTTLLLVLETPNQSSPSIFQFEDLDGPGGNPPTIIADTLTANTQYFASIEVFNGTENITPVIEQLQKEHQAFFIPTDVPLTFTYADQDEDGFPIGLFTAIRTGSAATGNLSIALVHDPNKGGFEVSQGNLNNAGGRIDIQVSIPIVVE